jgi:ATP-dependent helicase/nuclease subunit A
MINQPTPSDRLQRRAILEDLDKTMLVEAAAGTGKTTSMVARMVRLLATGKCTPEKIAAVTFTRKAAAELRLRFRTALKDIIERHGLVERDRLRQAILRSDGCFIGTIHSFCAYLLRERPIEAGLSLSFQEIDDAEDKVLLQEAWAQYVESLYEGQDPILQDLQRVGIEIEELKTTYLKLCDFQDIDEWPMDPVPLPNLDWAGQALIEYVGHMEKLLPHFPERPHRDDLMNLYEIVVLMYRQSRNLRRTDEFMEILDKFRNKRGVGKRWPEGIAQCKDETERLRSFIEGTAGPVLRIWRQHRYELLMRVILSGVTTYQNLKRQKGKLNFQDLLLFTARMLKDNSSVRAYFRNRFTHILIDEFQDTDPIQAEVIMLLTAEDPSMRDWKKCRPVPGSLFVVGDPKQSIYRFRRADIVTYNHVKSIISSSGGKLVTLSANFRALEPLIHWVNHAFEDAFNGLPREASPDYVALQPVKTMPGNEKLCGVRCIRIPEHFSAGNKVVSYDAEAIACVIAEILDSKLQICDSPAENAERNARDVKPSDFLIITPRLKNLQVYAKALQDRAIPFEVTGSTTLNEVPELSLLNSLLAALLEPHNPVRLVEVLRGPLFGVSDPELYEFKKAGGQFCYYSFIPLGLPEKLTDYLDNAFERLKRYRIWFAKMPPVTALEKILSDFGLALRSGLTEAGNMNAGGLFKAIELLRVSQSKLITLHDLQKSLHALVTKEVEHDTMPALALKTSSVRLMNLHKAKGLEATFVFLADPTGSFDHEPLIYIDRSRDKVRGYAALHTRRGLSAKPSLLAEPVGWDELVRRENSFQKAEFLRFLYVAATRAGHMLTISLPAKKSKNPWAFFESSLEGAPEWVPTITSARETLPPQKSSSCGEVERVREEIQRRWSVVRERSFESSGVKARTVVSEQGVAPHQEGGTKWGTVIHSLLETAMKEPYMSLEKAARRVLTENGLDVGLTSNCMEVVHRVMGSQIWKRVRASRRVFVETPFQVLDEKSSDPGPEKPLLLRGVIDLVFEEIDGWVLIDYKTDRTSEEFLPSLLEHYRSQVIAYSQAWAKLTGTMVKEQGLFFTHSGRYVVLDSE